MDHPAQTTPARSAFGNRAATDQFLQCVLHPVRSIEEFAQDWNDTRRPPAGLWLLYSAVAVIDCLIFGATLPLVTPLAGSLHWAFTFTAAVGVAWFVFAPAMSRATGKPAPLVAHACLVAMGFAAGALEVALAVNLCAWWFGGTGVDLTAFNLICLAAGNVVAAAAMICQLLRVGVPAWKTLCLWAAAFNGPLAAILALKPGLIPS